MSFPIGLGFWKGQGGSCPSYTPGLYTAEEIDDLVNVDGYIPVASAAEFDKIDSGIAETMGTGTCWEGTYTTGGDKKYVQVEPFSFSGAMPNQFTLNATGIYDGNELVISNYTIIGAGGSFYKNGLFTVNEGIIRNVRTSNCSITLTSSVNPSLISAICAENIGSIENCIALSVTANGTTLNKLRVGSICGLNTSTGNIDNSSVNGSVFTHTSISLDPELAIASFIGKNEGSIQNCHVEGINSVTTEMLKSAGFVGENTGTIVSCYTNTSVDTSTLSTTGFRDHDIGGFVGLNTGTIERCYSTGNVNGFSGSATNNLSFGGFVGRHEGGSISQCYSTGNVNGSISVGGFAGTSINAGNITDCYATGNAFAGNASFGRCGGFAGSIRTGSQNVSNCYSTGSATGTSSGGFCGFTTAYTGTISASYWDTVASGNASSVLGTGQTTTALQTPTSNTGIYSAWSPTVWDFGTSVEYPTLTTTP